MSSSFLPFVDKPLSLKRERSLSTVLIWISLSDSWIEPPSFLELPGLLPVLAFFAINFSSAGLSAGLFPLLFSAAVLPLTSLSLESPFDLFRVRDLIKIFVESVLMIWFSGGDVSWSQIYTRNPPGEEDGTALAKNPLEGRSFKYCPAPEFAGGGEEEAERPESIAAIGIDDRCKAVYVRIWK